MVPDPAELAAIPEVSVSELCHSNRVAITSDGEVLHQATRLRADKDNTVQSSKGDICEPSSFSSLPDEFIHSSFSSIGVSLGYDDTSISKSILELEELEGKMMHESRSKDWKSVLLDKEEKNMAEEEEIDKFILNRLCGEIMDEVMDASSDPNDLTVPLSKTKHPDCKRKKAKKTTQSI